MLYRTSIGLDVHARSIAATAFIPETGEIVQKAFPYDAGKVAEWAKGMPQPARCVYESGPTGSGLKRKPGKAGVPCVVGAVSKVLRPPGDRARTDRRDAAFLARMPAVGNIVEVAMPTEAMEAARDLARAREDCRHDLMRARHLLPESRSGGGSRIPERPHGRRPTGNGSAGPDSRTPASGSPSGNTPRARVARARARKARRGHRGARRRGGHGPCGPGAEARQGDVGRDRLLHRGRDRGLLPLPGRTVVHVLRGARAVGAFGRGERLARQDRPDGQRPCEDPPRGGGMAARTAPEAGVRGSHGRCGGRACRRRRGCRAGEPQAPRPRRPSEGARQARQRREHRRRARARRVRLGARQDGRMMPLRPWAAAWQTGPSRKPAPGSMARGAIRERTMRSLRATRDPRHAEPSSRRHRNALPNARISDSRSCVESDTPRRRGASGGRYREWSHPRSGIRGWDHYAS